jgi:ATP-dependent DNA helicase PIF1
MRPTDGTYQFDLTRKQFPVRPCFGITSNKSQGQTLERVGLYIDPEVLDLGD